MNHDDFVLAQGWWRAWVMGQRDPMADLVIHRDNLRDQATRIIILGVERHTIRYGESVENQLRQARA